MGFLTLEIYLGIEIFLGASFSLISMHRKIAKRIIKDISKKDKFTRKFYDEVTIKEWISRDFSYTDFQYKLRLLNFFHHLSPKENDIILDLGCGVGDFTKLLVEKGSETIGLDISLTALNIAKKRLKEENVHFILADAEALPLSEDRIDKILCSDVLEHLPNTDKAIKEMVRVLKKGGVLSLFIADLVNFLSFSWLMIKIRGFSQQTITSGHVRFLTTEKITETLRSNGLFLLDIRHAYFLGTHLLNQFFDRFSMMKNAISVVSIYQKFEYRCFWRKSFGNSAVYIKANKAT